MDQVYDTLNRLQNPDFLLALKLDGSPQTPPAGAALRKKLEKWLGQLSWEEVRSKWVKGGFDALPEYRWEHAGWSILFQAIPKAAERRGSGDIRPIGVTMPTMGERVTVDGDIKRSIGAKNKYGELTHPFVVAINVVGDFCSADDVMNAVFGHDTIIFGPEGTRPGERLRDGAWDGPHGPQNTTISAVMVFRDLNPGNMRDVMPWLVHNPWAAKPLDLNELPFSQYLPDHTTGHLIFSEGAPPGEFLGLPEPWPPKED